MITGRFIAIVPCLRAMPHVEALGGRHCYGLNSGMSHHCAYVMMRSN